MGSIFVSETSELRLGPMFVKRSLKYPAINTGSVIALLLYLNSLGYFDFELFDFISSFNIFHVVLISLRADSSL